MTVASIAQHPSGSPEVGGQIFAQGDCGCTGCCDSGCDTCCDTGCSCCPPSGFFGGAEGLFLTARSADLKAFYTENAANNQTTQQFNFDPDFSPRLWLEWVNCDGFGFRVRYFNYEDDDRRVALDNNANPNFVGHDIGESEGELFMDVDTATGETFVAETNLEISTWDWEATQRLDFCPLSLTVAGGVRYVQTKSSYRGLILDAALAPTGEALLVNFEFEGVGPTLALDARRQLGYNLALLANTRGSVAVGTTDVFAVERNAGGAIAETFTSQREDGLFVAELLLGVEWSQDYCGNRFFARATYESQYWSNVGLATRLGEFNVGSTLFLSGFGFGIGMAR